VTATTDQHRRNFIFCAAAITVSPALAFTAVQSSRMPALIAEFQRLTYELDDIDHSEDPFGWGTKWPTAAAEYWKPYWTRSPVPSRSSAPSSRH